MNELFEHFNIIVKDISNLDGDINYTNIKYALKANDDKKYDFWKGTIGVVLVEGRDRNKDGIIS